MDSANPTNSSASLHRFNNANAAYLMLYGTKIPKCISIKRDSVDCGNGLRNGSNNG
jgi:hypothetical protein